MSIRWARRKTKKIIRWVRDNFEIAIPAAIWFMVVVVSLVGGLTNSHW